MSDENDFDAPDHCTRRRRRRGGQRLFLFYCRQGLSETTVKVEKQQVAVLAGYLGRIVKELGRPGHLPDDLAFYGTEDFEWVVGTIGVSYDEELDRVIVVLEEVGVDEDEDEDEDDMDSGHVLRGSLSPTNRRRPLPFTPRAWWSPGARPARCARSRWTQPGTTARAPTGTGHR